MAKSLLIDEFEDDEQPGLKVKTSGVVQPPAGVPQALPQPQVQAPLPLRTEQVMNPADAARQAQIMKLQTQLMQPVKTEAVAPGQPPAQPPERAQPQLFSPIDLQKRKLQTMMRRQ